MPVFYIASASFFASTSTSLLLRRFLSVYLNRFFGGFPTPANQTFKWIQLPIQALASLSDGVTWSLSVWFEVTGALSGAKYGLSMATAEDPNHFVLEFSPLGIINAFGSQAFPQSTKYRNSRFALNATDLTSVTSLSTHL